MSLLNIVHDRHATKSVKWDHLEEVYHTTDVLPMWIADMDFPAPQAVNDAIIDRAQHGIYGYTLIDEDVKSSITNWLETRHQWSIDPDWLSFSHGVVTSLHMAIQALTEPHDKILIQTPVYTPFFKIIEAHDREIVTSSLVTRDNGFEIDFAHFEKQLQQGVKAFMFCSPHNPVGRVWTMKELEKIAELCLKYDVLILADEIHADFIYPGHKHIPIASLSEEVAAQTITFMSPSKTFNLAGLQASYMITSDAEKRARIDACLEKQGIDSLNTIGILAIEAAYTHGEPWLTELLALLDDHQQYVSEMFSEHAPELQVVPAEGTYLLWIDCSALDLSPEALNTFMVEEARVALNPGIGYGEEGAQYMRLNIACPRPLLEEGIHRIITAVKNK